MAKNTKKIQKEETVNYYSSYDGFGAEENELYFGGHYYYFA